jgi:hypothetical protein
MADTIRTEAEALALLVTAGSRQISAQDLRDCIYSLFQKAAFTTAPTLPVLADSAVPTPAAGTVAHYYSTTQAAAAFKDASGVVHKITHG